ncbi:hypothetical protein KY338_00800 [Candidatus Woesearchaeota archaeon]|nr:hypothetical protein [Candidatus Woesearchaeota archaeon]
MNLSKGTFGKMYKITNDEFNNTRPGPSIEYKKNRFKAYYTQTYKSNEGGICIDFKLTS